VHNDYFAALEKLYALEFTGMKLGLENTQELLHALGDPQKAYPAIHIAGTNGKGSVSAMIAAALQSNGYKTGLYTSPHLVEFTERIKVNGKEMPREYVKDFMAKISPKVEELQATFFETTTAMAFSYLRDEKIDMAVVETGLGGRLDSTNVLEHPLVTAITSIGLEHTQYLGDTLEKIAFEKAGIMKPGVPAVVNVKNEIKEVFRKRADELNSPLFFTDETKTSEYDIANPFPGEHQNKNLKTVLIALERSSLKLDSEKTKNGIENTTRLTGLRGRLEDYPYPPAVAKGKKLILDVAHNPDAFGALRDHFISIGKRPFVVAGFAKDKDIHSIFPVLKEFAAGFIATQAPHHRALDSDELAGEANKYFDDPISVPDILEAVGLALKTNELVLLTGSHYVVGEFLSKQ
jgi:dihydrofolate synthase/folylpolyglutamate synthase